MRAIVIATLTFAVIAAGTAAGQKTLQLDVNLHELESGGLHLAPDAINAMAGDTLQLTVVNTGNSPHNLIVCGDGKNPGSACDDKWGFTAMLGAGQIGQLSATAKKGGTFEYYCDIPGHKAAGMKGTLSVAGETGNETPGAALVVTLMSLGAVALSRRRTSE